MDPALPGRIDRQAAAIPELRSVLVVRGGYLVVGRYYGGATASTYQPVFSVTKSVTSALVGIALREGYLTSLEQTVGELLADKLPADPDPRMAKVTVQQLLTMTSGLPPDPDNRPVRMLTSRDWIRFVLGRRLLHDPGQVFAYSTEGSQLLSAIVATSSGQTTLAFARRHLFGPLGIATIPAAEPVAVETPVNISRYLRAGFAWARDPQGYHMGGGTLKLTAPDLAKLGYLYLNQGRWDRTQVVPADYVGASTHPQSGRGGLNNASYGYHWWVETVGDHAAFSAQGAGGQYVYVVPELDLVAVVTTSGERPASPTRTLITSLIVPAVKQ
jgi:CubicO group peptidase (beta-lactamase class C family)